MSFKRDSAVLWVNDAPDSYLSNGGQPPHGHVYRPRRTVQVSFESLDGRATRATFDVATGAVTVQDITDFQQGGRSVPT